MEEGDGGRQSKNSFWVLFALAVYTCLPQKAFESDVGNVLKESEILILDVKLQKAYDSTVGMYRETHFRSFDPYFLCCIKCFSAFRLVKWNTNEMILLCFTHYFRPTLKQTFQLLFIWVEKRHLISTVSNVSFAKWFEISSYFHNVAGEGIMVARKCYMGWKFWKNNTIWPLPLTIWYERLGRKKIVDDRRVP